ncbi:sigma factor [Mastigocladopsis repens]|uniref:sigma factor n=1 Tax=Mastigocladopsis repens TaxID=221287 RepID=UPI0003187E43|nr:sigma factor [Mastigocladopsis repens]
MDQIDSILEKLALAVKQYPPETSETKMRKLALTRLVSAIQKSGKLFCANKSDFPPQVYAEALQETWLYVCRKVHQYDPQKGKVMTWVNFILDKRFKDAINKYHQQQTRSLDEPIQNSNFTEGSETTLGETIKTPETTFSECEQVRQFIAEDADGEFKRKHIQAHPEANFQEIALRRLDKQSWQAMSDEWGITVSALSSFYQRSIKSFAVKIKEYLQN